MKLHTYTYTYIHMYTYTQTNTDIVTKNTHIHTHKYTHTPIVQEGFKNKTKNILGTYMIYEYIQAYMHTHIDIKKNRQYTHSQVHIYKQTDYSRTQIPQTTYRLIKINTHIRTDASKVLEFHTSKNVHIYKSTISRI